VVAQAAKAIWGTDEAAETAARWELNIATVAPLALDAAFMAVEVTVARSTTQTTTVGTKAAGEGGGGGTLLPDSYWAKKKAPTQVTPGTRQTTDIKPSSRGDGSPYRRDTHYDEYGRQTGQTHHGSHGEPDVHPNPHHHRRDPATGQKIKNPEDGTKIFPGPHPDRRPD